MSVCFHSNGYIRLKPETANDFVDKLNELLNRYQGEKELTFNKPNGLLVFKNYARVYFIGDCKKLIEQNTDTIIDARIWFECNDEDGSCDNPFPFVIMFEVVKGKLYEETLNTHLPSDWTYRLLMDTIESSTNP